MQRSLSLPLAAFALAASVTTSLASRLQAVACEQQSSACPVIQIAGDPPSPTQRFTGYADPSVIADPVVANRLWLAYSYLQGKRAKGSWGQTVGVPVVATHLAQSDDGGRSWRLHSMLWDSALSDDPEGKTRPSYFGSETPSLAATRKGGTTTWYSIRLSYFLEPESAYKPRFATGWLMRVAKAEGDTPAVLAGAPDTVLGVRTTASGYGANVDLNSLSPELGDCAMWNNPIITVQDARLYLVAECLVFRSKTLIQSRTRMVVLSTDPGGGPKSWSWRYDGIIADETLAQQLGGDQLVSPEIQRAPDGRLLFIVSPQTRKEVYGQGCAVMLLESLAPPKLKRDAAGLPVIIARQTSALDADWRTGACTYSAASATGLITVGAVTRRGLSSDLRATGLTLR